jgi:hypothetical protein
MVEVEPGIFRPRGAFGPLMTADGEVVARRGWPHMICGLTGLTADQCAIVDQVAREADGT